jgi:hypothetical protein
MGDTVNAIKTAQRAIAITHEAEVERFQSMPITALGIAYLKTGKFLKGIVLIFRSLIMLPPWQTADGKLVLAVVLKQFSRYLPKIL